MKLRIILAFHIALIYYTQDFRVYEGTRDQPMPEPFPPHPFFKEKALGTRLPWCSAGALRAQELRYKLLDKDKCVIQQLLTEVEVASGGGIYRGR